MVKLVAATRVSGFVLCGVSGYIQFYQNGYFNETPLHVTSRRCNPASL